MKLALATLFAACACSGGGPDPSGADAGGSADASHEGSGELLLGGAEDTGTGFVDLIDGADAALIAGAQGGYHVWTSLRARGIEGELRIEREARRMSDGVLVLKVPVQELLVPGEAMEDWWQQPDAWANFMCPSPVGIQVYDQEVQFTVQVTTVDGDFLAEDRIILVPRCPAGDEANCHDRCAG
jgi:hypothetical protein